MAATLGSSALDVALVLGAEDLLEDEIDHAATIIPGRSSASAAFRRPSSSRA